MISVRRLTKKIDMGYTGDREAILDNTLFDSICTILFLKGNQLVAFSSVYRNVIDFSPLNKKPISRLIRSVLLIR